MKTWNDLQDFLGKLTPEQMKHPVCLYNSTTYTYDCADSFTTADKHPPTQSHGIALILSRDTPIIVYTRS